MVKRNVKCNNGKLKHAPPDHNDLPKRSSARVTRKPRVCTRQVGQKPSGKLQFGAEARTLPEIGAILTPMPGPRPTPPSAFFVLPRKRAQENGDRPRTAMVCPTERPRVSARTPGARADSPTKRPAP